MRIVLSVAVLFLFLFAALADASDKCHKHKRHHHKPCAVQPAPTKAPMPNVVKPATINVTVCPNCNCPGGKCKVK